MRVPGVCDRDAEEEEAMGGVGVGAIPRISEMAAEDFIEMFLDARNRARWLDWAGMSKISTIDSRIEN